MSAGGRSALWASIVIALVAPLLVATRADAAVYWVTGGTLGRANLDGSQFQSAFLQPPNTGTFVSAGACEGVAENGSHIYWADGGRGSIGRANLDGSDADFDFITGLEGPCGVAVDGTSIYWAEGNGESIGRATLEGNAVNRKYLDGVWRPCGVAVGGGYLYWTSSSNNYVARAPLSGGSGKVIFRGVEPFYFCGVAVAGSHVYWGGFGTSIGRAGLDGSNPEPAFISGVERPCGVTVDGPRIYWTEQADSPSIRGMDLEGGGAIETILGRAPASLCGLAVDSLVVPPPLLPTSYPPSTVSFRRPRHAAHAPTTFVGIEFSQGGEFTVQTGKAIGWSLVGGRAGLSLSGAEERVLKIAPGRGRRGKALRMKLHRKGKVRVAIRVRFSPARGPAAFAKTHLVLLDR